MMKMKFVMLLVLICMLTKPAAAIPYCQIFDFYALAMEWGPGYCSLFKEYCNEPHLDAFTLHDLRRSNQYDHRDCLSDHSWGTEDLKANLTNSGVPDLISNLERKWPGGWTMPGGWYTWTQAWNQYGLCTGLTPIVYFNSTLNISNRGFTLRSLSFDGIVPTNNNTYKAVEIYSAAAKHGLCILICIRNPKSTSTSTSVYIQDYILVEIHFCFNVTIIKPGPCPLSRDPFQSCGGPYGNVWFLPKQW